MRILVVDDDPDTCELYSYVFGTRGAEVIAAESSVDAVQAVRDWRPDVVITDLYLAGEDGRDVLHAIRALGPTNGGDTPAIAVSGCLSVWERADLRRGEFDDFFVKPVALNALVTTVAALARTPDHGAKN